MENRIAQALNKLFDRNRIVFWYDAKKELRADFEAHRCHQDTISVVRYPLTTEQVEIDLDDGVKVNYPKLGAALKKIPGLEAKEDE